MSQQGGEAPKKICVVLDTNVWVYRTLLLRTALGAALTHSLVRLQGTLGLPEVLEMEIVKHTVREGRKSVDAITRGVSRLSKLTGLVGDHAHLVYTEVTLKEAAKKRLEELCHLIERVPFTFDHARSALERVMDGTPPNGPDNQQYKDSAIWEAVLELSRERVVHFVTKDMGFFADRKPGKGLAHNLKEEADAVGAGIIAHHNLRTCLEALNEDVTPLDPEELAAAANRAVIEDLREIAANQEFELADLTQYSVSTFLTESTNVLAMSFELTYEASVVPTEEGPLIDASLVVTGECSFDIPLKSASDVRLDWVRLLDPEGALVPGKAISYLYGGAHLGSPPKTWPYEFKFPLNPHADLTDLLRTIQDYDR
ncbi:MAG TPA: PIN domain-containing protein [Rubrobacteraceae bacterium]|nr:PIN domain-containing protein [Rubrobacteraceae bacterium]